MYKIDLYTPSLEWAQQEKAVPHIGVDIAQN